jgi:peptidoglycan biosynthesis protein MviN/MurJ (putative lipid II flippase)
MAAMLLRAGILSLLLLLASRLGGLARESMQAAAFGTSGLGDVAVLMLSLPDWLAGLVASGALAYVLLPHWAATPPHEHARSQRAVATMLLVLGLAGGAALWLLPSAALGVLASGLPAALVPQAGAALAWSAMAIPAALLAALWATRLQFERDFVGMYAAGLVVNAVLVAALAYLALRPEPATALSFLGVALVLAMLARLAWLGWRLPQPPLMDGPLMDGPLTERSLTEGSTTQVPPASPAPLPAVPVWLWAMLSAGLPLALPFVARSIASQAGEGELAAFNYAWKLVELPLTLAVQLVATLAFPAIARAVAAGQDPGPQVRHAVLLAWTLACAAAAALVAGAPGVARLLFGWGRMTPDSVLRLADWAAIGAWSLLPQALVAVALTVLASVQRLRPVVVAYGVALLALLLTGAWSRGDGGRLMIVLNLGLGFVALVSLLVLGRGAGRWLPWRPMAVSLALLMACAALRRSGLLDGLDLAAGLACAVAAALAVVAGNCLASAEFRAALRR